MKTVSRKVVPRVGSWVVVAGAAVVLSAGLVMRGGAEPEVGLEPALAQGVEDFGSSSLTLPSEREVLVPAPTPEYLDPEATLLDFWGEAWPEVQRELFPDGVNASELSPIVPWSEVEELHFEAMVPNGDMRVEALYRKLVSWPGWEFRGGYANRPDKKVAELTPDSLFWSTRCRGVSDLDQQDVEQLELDFKQLNAELDALARAYIDGIGAAVRYEFDRGGFERAPIAFRKPADRSETELYSHKVSAGGWVTRIQLDASDHPSLGLLKDEIDDLRQKRKRQLRVRVAELRQAPQPAS